MSINSFPNQVLGDGIGEIPSLECGISESPDGGNISIPEGQTPIRQIVLLAKVLHKWGDLPQLAPWQSWEQVMLKLKLQPSMEPIHPRGASDVQGPARLLLKPVVPARRTKINIGREMVQAELDVLNRCHHEAHNHKHHPLRPIGQAGNQKQKPSPENENPHYVERPFGDIPPREQQQKRLNKQIDPPNTHNRVKCKVLVANQEPRQRIKIQFPSIKTRRNRIEEVGRDRKDRNVLKIRIMVKAIAGNVVSIVSPFPPRNADPSDAIPSQELRQFVVSTAGHDLVMPGIMTNVSTLNPEKPQQNSASHMDPKAIVPQYTINNQEKHNGNRNKGVHDSMTLFLEQP